MSPMNKLGKELKVEELVVHFKTRRSLLGAASIVHAVDGVNFTIPAGTTLGIVGESGSGKSTTAMAIMQLLELTSGRITLGDVELSSLSREALRLERRNLQIIFQDPFSSLNPRKRAGEIVREPLDLMRIGENKTRAERVNELFTQVGLRPEQQALFPHQFSGGQRQRLGFARALSTTPGLIVCDEPVSALDVAIQAQILNLMSRLQSELGLTYLFISHDLGVVQHLCDEIAVMYLGQIVEQADRISLFGMPQHPYTQALLASVPSLHRRKSAKDGSGLTRLVGDPPSPINPPPGCRFASRCPRKQARCVEEMPTLSGSLEQGTHRVACHFPG